MQCDGQLDHAKTGAQMPPRDGDCVDCFGAQLVGHLPQLALFELPQVIGSVNPIQEGRL
jgi:hypothetical protein